MTDVLLTLKLSAEKALSELKGLGEAAESVSKDFTGLGIAAGAAFASISAAAALSVKEFANFENRMLGVKTLLDETSFAGKDLEEGFKGMSDAMLDMAKTVPVGMDSATKALFDMVSAGVKADEAVQAVGVAGKLAVAGITDVSVATDGITSALNAYGRGAEYAEVVASKFFTAQKAGKTTVEQLSSSFGVVGATAAAMNVSFDEVLAATSAMTLGGTKTAEAMTGMKAVLSGIAKPTADAAKEAERLGVQFDLGALKSKGLSGFLDSLTSSSKWTSDSVVKLFGSVEAANVMFALTGKQAGAFKDILGKLGNETQSVAQFQKAYADQSASLENQWKLMKNSTQALAIEIGGKLAPAVASLVGMAKSAIDWFSGLSDGWKNAILIAGGFAAAIAGITAAAVAFLAVLGPVTTTISGLIALGPTLIPFITGLATTVGTVAVGAFTALQAAVVKTTAVLLANPIILALTGIAAACTALYFAVDNNFLGIQEIVVGVFGFLAGYFKNWVSSVGDLFGGLGEILMGAVTLDADRLKAGAVKAAQAIAEPIKAGMAEYRKMSDATKEAFEARSKAQAAAVAKETQQQQGGILAQQKALEAFGKNVETARAGDVAGQEKAEDKKTDKHAKALENRLADQKRAAEKEVALVEKTAQERDRAWSGDTSKADERLRANLAGYDQELQKVLDLKNADLLRLQEVEGAEAESLQKAIQNADDLMDRIRQNKEDEIRLENMLAEERERLSEDGARILKYEADQWEKLSEMKASMSKDDFERAKMALEKELEGIRVADQALRDQQAGKIESEKQLIAARKKITEDGLVEIAAIEREGVQKAADEKNSIWNRLWDSIKASAATVGDAMLSVGRGIVDGLGAAFTFFNKGADDFAKSLDSLGGAFSFGDLADNVRSFMQVLPDLIERAIGGLNKVIPDMVQAFARALPKMINMILNALPKLVQGLVKSISAVVQAISDALPGIVQAIVRALPGIIQGILDLLPVVLNAIMKAIPVLIDGIVKALPVLLDGIIQAIPIVIQAVVDNLPTIVQSLIAGVMQAFAALVDALPGLIKVIIDAIPEIIDMVARMIPVVIKTVIENLPTIITAIIEAIPQLITAIILGLPDIIKALVMLLPTIWWELFGGMIKAIPEFFTSIGQIFQKSFWRNVAGAFVDGWNSVSTWFSEAFSMETLRAFIGAIQDGWDAVSGWFSDLFSTQIYKGVYYSFTEGMSDAWDGVTAWFKDSIFSWFYDAITGAWDLAKDGLTYLFKDMWIDAWESSYKYLLGFFGDLFSYAFDPIVGAFESIGRFLERLWDRIASAADVSLSDMVPGGNYVSDKWDEYKPWWNGKGIHAAMGWPLRPIGRDVIPAMVAPGEFVINPAAPTAPGLIQEAIAAARATGMMGGGGQDVRVILEVKPDEMAEFITARQAKLSFLGVA